MMEEIYGLIPSSNSEDYSCYYSHDVASLKDGEEAYEAFVRSPWLSTTSSGASLSAAAAAAAAATISDHDDDPANTCNSIQKSGSSSLQEESTTSSAIKAKISSHPLYPKLLEAYINCQKIGAPPEMANLFDKIVQENDAARNTTVPYCFGEDPELDEFMETYCEMLAKYKLDLEKPYQEATTFLSNIESQLSDLCNKAATTLGDEDGVSSNDDTSSGEREEQQCDRSSEVREIKDKLLRQYGGYISSLRHEFSKKKKNGKLPTNARDILQHWWTIHYNWPYPTEEDKIALAESTGLDQKQINNWFINQRKRHWKPSDQSLKPFLLNSLSGFFLPE